MWLFPFPNQFNWHHRERERERDRERETDRQTERGMGDKKLRVFPAPQFQSIRLRWQSGSQTPVTLKECTFPWRLRPGCRGIFPGQTFLRVAEQGLTSLAGL